MVKPRRAFEFGHRPKFLAIIDDSEECGRAVRYAARQAARAQAELALLAVVDVADFDQFIGVGSLMRQEAFEEAQKNIDRHQRAVADVASLKIEALVRMGETIEEILRLIDEDEDIAYLVLAAGVGAEGPGPLVSLVGGRNAQIFPIPVVVVPGALSNAQIDALT